MAVLAAVARVSPGPAPAHAAGVVSDPDAFRSLAEAPPAPPLPNETAITAPESFDEAAAPSDPPPRQLASGRFGNVRPEGGTWAVLIGINDYPGSSHDLRSAVADVDDVDAALAGMGVPPDHRLVIKDRQASAVTIRTSIDWLKAHSASDAVAVFFYAGHVRKVGNTTEAIVAADGGTVTDADLSRRLADLRATRAWIGIAGCYGGGFVEALAPGRVLTAAAPANQLAYENAAFGRSYMVQFMVREAMLDGRAPATVQTAFEYARSTIARDYPGREPVQVDLGNGALNLRPPGAPPAPAPRPAPAAPPANSGSASSPPSGGRGTTTTTTEPKKCQGVANPLIKCK